MVKNLEQLYIDNLISLLRLLPNLFSGKLGKILSFKHVIFDH